MFFTREDILKIQQALLQLGVKDSELPSTESVTYDDTLSIVQDGKNKQIGVKDFFNQISLWKREDFLNITDRYDEHYIMLLEAINLVPVLQRKDGLVITFQDTNGDWRIYQFRGNITEFLNEEKWFDLYDYRNYIIKSFLPDEEDITALTPDENGNSLLALKDRIYNPAIFSGKGYKFVRKNIINIELATIKISVTNPTTLEGDIYFKINNKGTTVHLSPTIHNTTKLVSEAIKDVLITAYNDYKVTVANSVVTLTRKYSGNTSPTTFEMYNTGVKVIVEDYTTISERNIITQEDINEEDTIYEIRYDFDLDGKTITIPNNCVLYFTSGKFYNGSINMDNTIVSTLYEDVLSEVNINGNYYNIQKHIKDHQSQLDDKQSQIDDKQQQITANDEDISLLQTRSTQMEETIKSIAATGGASQATAVTYDNANSQLSAINIQSAVDELQGSKIDKTSILQESGEATDKVMSQKAVSSKLNDLSSEASFHFNKGHDDYYDIKFPIKKGNKYLVVSTYDSITINTTNDFSSYLQRDIANKQVFVAEKDANGIRGWINMAPSGGDITIYSGIKVDIFDVQGSIDNLANTKFDKSSISQDTGDAEDKVMSQKAVSSKLSDLSAEAYFHFNEGHNDSYFIEFPIKKGNKYLVKSDYDSITINTTNDFSTNILSVKLNEVFIATENANGIRGWIDNADKSGDITIYSGLNAAFVSISDEIAKNKKDNEDSISKNTQDIDEITRNIGSSQVFEFSNGHNDYYNIIFPIKKGNKYLVISTYDGITINTTNDFSGYLQTGIVNKQVFVADQDANGIRGWINMAPSGGNITIYSGLNISEPTFKKSLFTIGDSLCDTGVWQTHLANLKGMLFDQSINKGQFPISYGGTTTGYIASNSGINRARNLVEISKKQSVDYVIIENINDRFYVDGKISDSAWMISQTLIPHSTFDTEEEANSYIENLSSILSSIASDKRLKGSVIVVNNKSTTRNAYKLTVTSKAIIDGDITITDSNGMVRSVHVTTDMEITDIASEIARYNFGSGWDTSDNKDGSVTISYYTTPDKTFSFSSNNTGVNVTIEEDYNVVSNKRYFTGYSASEWEDTTKWVSYINLYQLYKGMLEYLKSNLPNAKIYWLIPTTFTLGFNGTEYANSDGSFNMEKYKESTYYKQMQKLFDCQKEVAKYYDIPILDMEEYSNINLFNAKEFYYANDVHPKINGYRRWAETISKILC